MSNKQQFDDLTQAEEDWIKSQLQGVRQFVDACSPDDAGKPITLQALDRAFAAWLETAEEDPTLVNAAINAVGTAFGEVLVKGAGFKWVIATDENGSDLAVLALPGKGDVLVYPANFVAKRWERRESDFLSASFESIKQQVAKVADAWKSERI